MTRDTFLRRMQEIGFPNQSAFPERKVRALHKEWDKCFEGHLLIMINLGDGEWEVNTRKPLETK